MKLYDLARSGNCHKVRLFLSLIGEEAERVTVDLPGGEHKREAFLAINPKGEIPVLQDGDVVLADSQAILVYLARKFQREDWYPLDPVNAGRIQYWLSTAAKEVALGLSAARAAKLLGYPIDYDDAVNRAQITLTLLDNHLTGREWLEAGRPTIADVAIFPYVALAGDGGISLESYPQVLGWVGRIKSLPGFVGMAGME